MPVSEAFKRCPVARSCFPGQRYAEKSAEVMAVFERSLRTLRRMSIVEAFLDMTGNERLWGPPSQAAMRLKIASESERG